MFCLNLLSVGRFGSENSEVEKKSGERNLKREREWSYSQIVLSENQFSLKTSLTEKIGLEIFWMSVHEADHDAVVFNTF